MLTGKVVAAIKMLPEARTKAEEIARIVHLRAGGLD
jgi:hypothetical protein